ncbi:MAG: tRNA (guanine37-N1)-methyltransferase [Patescibacteria group bacterium]|nr:tRNA (guanine37-N1)-methyltransferase [Patescibacteria group bacterium]
MRFDIITIFPEAFESYFQTSILKRAQAKKLVKINIHNLRKWTTDRHETVDGRPYGGGAGMIFLIEPVFKAVKELLRKEPCLKKRRVILFSVKGKKLTQKDVVRLKNYEQLILICPHYEGFDERIKTYLADEEISIGDYVLTGGELPAMVLIDAISRLIPGVIKEKSLKEESFSLEQGTLEYPQYSRPEIFYPNPRQKKISWRVPKVLLSGHHQKIKEWRDKHVISQKAKFKSQN